MSDDLLPAWAAPGPTIHAQLLEVALKDATSVRSLDGLLELVPPQLHAAATRWVDSALVRTYATGVSWGFSEAVRRLNESETT